MDKLDRLKAMLIPNSLFFVPEADTRASINWAISEIIELRANLAAAKEDRKELREELALFRQLVTQRSDAVKKIAEQLIKKAT
jgi:hypothetical protein